jgi:hypothetical protein
MMNGATLSPTSEARALGRYLMRPERAPTRWIRDDYGFVTAQLLTPRLAEAFGLDPGGREGETRAARVFDAAALAVPLLPARLRFVPAYVEALGRIEGRGARDRLGELMTRLYVGRRRSVPPPR